MYNDQYGGRGDFMSLGLVNGRVEFRFDVGSGTVAITSDEISLHTWHTLRFRKDRNIGQFIILSCCIFPLCFLMLLNVDWATGRESK